MKKSLNEPVTIRDSARERIEDDELARTTFAEKLARAVALTPTGNEARVVAVFGKWGAGKTTVKNFVTHFLRKGHGIEPVEFSPWEWSGRDMILDVFFTQLGSELRGKKWKWGDFSLGCHIRRYAVTLGVFTPLMSWGKTWWMPWVMLVFGGSSFLSIIQSNPTFFVIAVIFLGCGVSLTALQLITEGFAGVAAKWTELRRDSLESVRDDLKAVLLAHPKPVVVYIDDLDRLEPNEIRQIIALIKATFNLPRVVFVLFCQREKVARALDDISGGPGCGDEYLEKIVQEGFHLPIPQVGRLNSMLSKGLKQIVDDMRLNREWNEARWHAMYTSVIGEFFQTPRHVMRFLCSLTFQLRQHVQEVAFEANPADVAALEVLRLFEPAVYERLSEHFLVMEAQLLGNPWVSDDDDGNKLQKYVEQLSEVASEQRRDKVIRLLRELFPQLNHGMSIPESEREAWDRELRICHRNHYHRYFELVLTQGQVTAAEFNQLKESAIAGQEAFGSVLCEFEQAGLLRNAIERAYVITHEIDWSAKVNVVRAISVMGDRLPSCRGYGEDDDLKLSAMFVVMDIIRKADSEHRVSLIREVLEGKVGLDFPLHMVTSLNRKTDYETIDLEVDKESEQELESKAVVRVAEAAANGRLWRSAWLGWHLSFWRKHYNLETIRNWVKKQVTDTSQALHLLKAYVSISTSAKDYYPRLQAADIEEYIELLTLEKLMPSELPAEPRDHDAVIMFRKALKLKSEGKSYKEVRLNDRDP